MLCLKHSAQLSVIDMMLGMQGFGIETGVIEISRLNATVTNIDNSFSSLANHSHLWCPLALSFDASGLSFTKWVSRLKSGIYQPHRQYPLPTKLNTLLPSTSIPLPCDQADTYVGYTDSPRTMIDRYIVMIARHTR